MMPPSSTTTPIKSILVRATGRVRSTDSEFGSAPPSRRSVSFSPRIRGRQIGHLSDMSPDEFDSLWYTEQDQARVASDVVANIRDMRMRASCQRQTSSPTGTTSDEDEHCPRGLEHMISNNALTEQTRSKNRFIQTVLQEQSHQRKSGVVCPVTLAAVASQASQEHKRVALVRAAEDAASTRRYLLADVVSRAIRIGGQPSSSGAPTTATATNAASSATANASVAGPGLKRESSIQFGEQRSRDFLQQVSNNAQKRRRNQRDCLGSTSPGAMSA